MSFHFALKIAAIAFSMSWGVVENLFARRKRRTAGASDSECDRGTFLWITVSVAVGMSGAATLAFSGIGEATHAWTWELAGLLTLLAGVVIRLHAIAILANQFTWQVTILAEHELVRRGLYRYLRHPSYLGQILILVGLGALMANGIALLAAPLPAIVALVWRIQVEEHAMAERFGVAYEDYRRATHRLLPRVW
jgi:protein-S-isoprenylcysteine O-methyltransferase